MFYQSILVIFSFFLSAIDAQNFRPGAEGPACVNSPFKSDGFLFVLNWPISFCAKNRRGCVLDRPIHRWLIHGLWPQFNITKQQQVGQMTGSPFPQYCCHEQSQFAPEVIMENNNISEKMSKNWYSLQTPNRGNDVVTQSISFWQHEWNKHGTCALNRDGKSRMTQQQYFITTLMLNDRFKIGNLLTDAKIHPSNRKIYSRESIHQALSPTIDSGSLRLNCDRLPGGNRRSNGGVGVLSEIQVCLDLNLEPINCGHLIDSGIPRRNILANSGEVDDFECGHSVLLMAT